MGSLRDIAIGTIVRTSGPIKDGAPEHVTLHWWPNGLNAAGMEGDLRTYPGTVALSDEREYIRVDFVKTLSLAELTDILIELRRLQKRETELQADNTRLVLENRELRLRRGDMGPSE